MKSTSGQYFIGLDHLRAFAAFMVFVWHFSWASGSLYAEPPIPPFSLLTEGHTGVALFMALSGYLFAKLLADKKINFRAFIWNRFLRLAPLLILTMVLYAMYKGYRGQALDDYIKLVASGWLYPNLPNGGWSITVEFHFYLILPLLLLLVRKWQYSLFFVLVLALVIRTYLYYKYGEVQVLSYWTLVGRIDQFLLGIMAYQFRNKIAHKHVLMVISTVAFVWFYSWFDNLGGYYQSPSYPSPSAIWIYLPTFEGLFYALLIAWYDNSINHSTGRISRFIALIGNYSYSIYLFHLFFVFEFAAIVDKYIVQSSSIYSTLLLAPVFYLALVPIGYLSFRFIEAPFLKFRTNYIITKVSA